MINDSKLPGESTLTVPVMDHQTRRSMEDEERPLPEGWIRQWDTNTQHHFYVDTRANPPRSIWNHPLEDKEYLESTGHQVSESESSDDEQPRGQSSGGVNRDPQTTRGPIGRFIDRITGAGGQNNQRRFYDRRQVLVNNGGFVPTRMAGPMYPTVGVMPAYAPPAYPYSRRHERRAERRLRRAERRAVRRGYAVPVIAQPVVALPPPGYQGPLFNYAGPSNRPF